jgi:hypothetical protein
MALAEAQTKTEQYQREDMVADAVTPFSWIRPWAKIRKTAISSFRTI